MCSNKEPRMPLVPLTLLAWASATIAFVAHHTALCAELRVSEPRPLPFL